MFVVTIGSLFMVSILIGILSNEIEGRVDALRRGRSSVLESDHTVILGWSPQVFTIISELVLANENRKHGAVIAILAEKDKVEMEDEIHEPLPRHEEHQDRLPLGQPDRPDRDRDRQPAYGALDHRPAGRQGPGYLRHQIRPGAHQQSRPPRRTLSHRDPGAGPKNMEVLRMIGQKDLVQPVLTNDLIARVVAQTSRQSGLSVVYTELMNFSGDEIYFTDVPLPWSARRTAIRSLPMKTSA